MESYQILLHPTNSISTHAHNQNANSSCDFLMGSSPIVSVPRDQVAAQEEHVLAASYSGICSVSGSEEITGKKKKTKKVRKPKIAFQTRSKVDTLDDGYRWRKYGQKAVKNNKFPRSYYRCTREGCPVKKQVQRLTKDEEVVVTTYEGIHTHPVEKSTDNFENILAQMQIYPLTTLNYLS